MISLVGMAGLAEAAEFIVLSVGYGGLLLSGLAATVGLFAYSRVASGVALALVLALTLMLTPWEAFRTFESADPDVHDWVAAWRGFGWCWGVAVAAAVAVSVRAFCFPPKTAVHSPGENETLLLLSRSRSRARRYGNSATQFRSWRFREARKKR